MKKTGVKVFVTYDKKLLLILRDNKSNIPFPNTWNLPGGDIDEDESCKEAVNRELKEEININPSNITYLGKQIYQDGSV
ncbi:NUDIX domain-containing protein, partial [Patescibacteria group bacterium]|nr:NUDIX domain-containing protein [Patescibacteria group bacterium]